MRNQIDWPSNYSPQSFHPGKPKNGPLDAGGIVKQHVIDSLASQMLQLLPVRFQTAFTQLLPGHLILIKRSYGKATKKIGAKTAYMRH